MNFKFNLGVNAKLPENDFSLSELVITTKELELLIQGPHVFFAKSTWLTSSVFSLLIV